MNKKQATDYFDTLPKISESVIATPPRDSDAKVREWWERVRLDEAWDWCDPSDNWDRLEDHERKQLRAIYQAAVDIEAGS